MADTVESLKAENEKLKGKIKRLKTRLNEKKKYETALLVGTGAAPGYIAEIDKKDREVLEER